MKKYLIVAILMFGLAGTSGVLAQDNNRSVQERANRKERKMRKKDMKVHHKMFNDHGVHAAKKEEKSRKKEYKKDVPRPQ